MIIGILGAGSVGRGLAEAFIAAGHQVIFGVRDPESPKTQTALNTLSNVQAVSIPDAVQGAELVINALPWPAAGEAAASISDWDNKILIDASNRFGGGSAAEDLARMAHGARVVKAFNMIGAEHYKNPIFDGQAASMLYAGDDSEAKATVRQLLEELGFDPIDAGSLDKARLVEGLAELWVSLMRSGMGRNMAFRLIREK
jgi:8-hydroxy-5-deazaflavin:NADPH oxidoreductase